jgi:concanavalin A-like lectin/glucanase superfamily protein
MALQFDGTNSLQSAATIDLTAQTQLSIAFWFYKNAWGDNDLLALELGADSSGDGQIQINPEYSPTSTFAVTMRGSGGTADVATIVRPTGNNIDRGDPWHHYVIVFDLLAGNPGIRHITHIWVDGVDQTLTDQVLLYNDSGGHFSNSTWNVMSRNNASLFTPGRFAELGIWFGIATQTQVDALYNSGNGVDASTIAPANQLYYWQLCDATNPSLPKVGAVNMTLNSSPTFVAHPISGTGICGGGAASEPGGPSQLIYRPRLRVY